MRIVCGPDPEVSTILLASPEGRLDAHGSVEFLNIVEPKLRKESPSLIVDMTGVEFVSSAGLTVLVKLLSACRQHGGHVALFGCRPQALTTLRISTIDRVLNLCDSLADSREKLRPRT